MAGSIFPSTAAAQNQFIVLGEDVVLPTPGVMLTSSPQFNPPIIRGITIHPEDPFVFDFIVHPGDNQLTTEAIRNESKKLISYFMAALTLPENEMWVNLSPYEKDRIVPKSLGDTLMGKDLLAQDYLLKQLTASLIYPENKLGSDFWNRVYQKAQQQYGTTNIPINTFNKVWIVPEKAVIYQNGYNVFVVDSHLKVLLDEDYLALNENVGSVKHGLENLSKDELIAISVFSKDIIQNIVIPEIEKEINEGRNFANLRQISNSVILAAWYKKNIQKGLLRKLYVNQGKTEGVDTQDKQINLKIYNQYIKAFKKGVYNYVKEDCDLQTQDVFPRKYFSGGLDYAKLEEKIELSRDASQLTSLLRNSIKVLVHLSGSSLNTAIKQRLTEFGIPSDQLTRRKISTVIKMVNSTQKKHQKIKVLKDLFEFKEKKGAVMDDLLKDLHRILVDEIKEGFNPARRRFIVGSAAIVISAILARKFNFIEEYLSSTRKYFNYELDGLENSQEFTKGSPEWQEVQDFIQLALEEPSIKSNQFFAKAVKAFQADSQESVIIVKRGVLGVFRIEGEDKIKSTVGINMEAVRLLLEKGKDAPIYRQLAYSLLIKEGTSSVDLISHPDFYKFPSTIVSNFANVSDDKVIEYVSWLVESETVGFRAMLDYFDSIIEGDPVEYLNNLAKAQSNEILGEFLMNMGLFSLPNMLDREMKLRGNYDEDIKDLFLKVIVFNFVVFRNLPKKVQARMRVELKRKGIEEVIEQMDNFEIFRSPRFLESLRFLTDPKISKAYLRADKAVMPPGGIDLNPNMYNMQIKGNIEDVYFQFDDLKGVQEINGLMPIIIHISPVLNIPRLLGK